MVGLSEITTPIIMTTATTATTTASTANNDLVPRAPVYIEIKIQIHIPQICEARKIQVYVEIALLLVSLLLLAIVTVTCTATSTTTWVS